MSLIERKRGSYKSLVFNADLTAIGKLYTDVSDIYFIIKKYATDADADALMIKTMSDGITIDADSQIIVPWATTEYDAFTIGKEYVLGLFIKFTGDPVADEDVKETFTIKITQDLLHDN